jgi:hypothetical protein
MSWAAQTSRFVTFDAGTLSVAIDLNAGDSRDSVVRAIAEFLAAFRNAMPPPESHANPVK